ncbi:hypothetical protein LB518_21970 [Mesorhizobium sp. BR1-1-16]|uniref:hypothetical protein n=1 Tax=Mesorhizobium sp. BR1-1-16 TaxID=2876653 RepID=UPI001CC9F3A1|nr:hypothetical protein [Mesorhizobium sp. BR1-1-16]MBZ9938980.1 hypothetical protein [Mesorhizobium sp. BR1-1-16]
MFTVHPDEIKDFTGDELVELLRRLLYAEARKAGVPLRGVHVPLQITVADGGQDASIIWTGGEASTDYLPGRDMIFQCKAKDTGNAQWEQEVWTKPTQKKTVPVKILNHAVRDVLARGGSYIGITAKALVGNKPADRINAIKKGITTAGGNPANLTAVDVYEGNKLAAWASAHPGVAVWIKQRHATIDLAGFSTLDHWGKRADIAAPPFIDSPDRKFSLGPYEANAIEFSQLAARLVAELEEPGASARIWGASGIGKTRALYHALSTSTGLLGGLASANFIFCDFGQVRERLWDVANQIVKEGSAAVLVVDGCPLDKARELNALAHTEDSQLRVITVGAEGLDHDDHCVMIRPTKADGATIRGILKNKLTKAKADELDYIADLCDGFPRIAVLATESYEKNAILKSVDDVAQQILDAAGAERETVRALECLSLFDSLSPDDNPDAFDDLAETLVHMNGELMYENLVIASRQHLVERSHGTMTAQPRPIADFLALRRLDYLRPSTLIGFLSSAQPPHRNAMLARWRFLARSRTLSEVIRILLRGSFADANIVHPNVAPYLTAFVHVEPDRTGTALYWAIVRVPLADVEAIAVTDELVDALRLLASRQDSFSPAAQIVLRLAAVAPKESSQPIMRLLRQLFQVALAGTQADDRRRRAALEEALEEDDPRIRRVGVEALGAMIQTHISRSEEFEQIGAEAFHPEWAPDDHGTINAYFDWALRRLLDLWRKDIELRPVIEEHVAGDIRNLLSPELLPTLEIFVKEVVDASGHWFGATHGIGDWLYFDRPEEPTNFSLAVRALFDMTLPTDPVDQVRLHSRYWMSDLRDPDKRYAQDQENPDYEYSARRVQALVPEIARSPDQLARAIRFMATEEMNAPQVFAQALAPELPDPLDTFEQAVAALDASGTRAGAPFVASLLSALDRQLQDRPDDVVTLESVAKTSDVLAANPMHIVTSLRVTDERLDAFTNDVRDGRIAPAQSVSISYGRGLEEVGHTALARFITALVDRGNDGGAWAALEILSMVTHGQKAIAPEIIDLAKLAILSPSIADDAEGNASNADYTYDRMLHIIDTGGGIDADFARHFAQQVVQTCRTTGPRRGGPSDALRGALAIVIQRAPAEVWPVLAGFYEIATRVERERLNAITSATKIFAYDVSRIGAGALFYTPLKLMLEWVAADPDGRIAFLLTFFPILEQKDGEWTWHPALQKLAKLYGGRKRFRDALRLRIYPNSWGGSLNPHLTSFKAPLASWTNDSVLGDWAGTMLDYVTRSLESEF